MKNKDIGENKILILIVYGWRGNCNIYIIYGIIYIIYLKKIGQRDKIFKNTIIIVQF